MPTVRERHKRIASRRADRESGFSNYSGSSAVMLEKIVWLLLFISFGALMLLLDHWSQLLRHQESYTRSELLDITAILRQRIKLLFAHPKRLQSYSAVMAFATGALLSWGLILLGGLLSPPSPPLPGYASSSLPNYFFQSVIFLIVLHFSWPAMQNLVGETTRRWLSALRYPFLFALSIGLAALSVTIWGVYHQLSFLYSVINMLLALGYAAYCLYKLPLADDDPNAPLASSDASATSNDSVAPNDSASSGAQP